MFPLHVASEMSTVGVVEYLAELSPERLDDCDTNKNFPLHHACRGVNCEVIAYLLDRPISSVSVSERNADGMLPIHLFCVYVNEQDEEGEDTPVYTETIWRLLTAYPETLRVGN
jgi:ankyrin repeat protein